MHESRVVSSTSSPATVVSCPTFSTRPVTAVCTPIAGTTTLPTTVSPTAVSPETTTVPSTDALTSLLGALSPGFGNSPGNIFGSPATQLGALNPLAALAAVNPSAALAKLSPALNIFNPAINPNAGLLAFNPGGAVTQALSSKAGLATLPFGKLLAKTGKIPSKTGI